MIGFILKHVEGVLPTERPWFASPEQAAKNLDTYLQNLTNDNEQDFIYACQMASILVNYRFIDKTELKNKLTTLLAKGKELLTRYPDNAKIIGEIGALNCMIKALG